MIIIKRKSGGVSCECAKCKVKLLWYGLQIIIFRLDSFHSTVWYISYMRRIDDDNGDIYFLTLLTIYRIQINQKYLQ